jgi:hypothetical protein
MWRPDCRQRAERVKELVRGDDAVGTSVHAPR